MTQVFQFAWRVLILSLITAPVYAQDVHRELIAPPSVRDPQTTIIEPTPIVIDADPFGSQEHSVHSPADALQLPALPAPQAVPVSAKYWIVSSRNSVQSMFQKETGRWGVDVYERSFDGQLRQSNLGSLSQQLIPGVPVVFFSHGSFVQWEGQCKEADAAYHRLVKSCPNQQFQMIFFTWPSDGSKLHLLPADVRIRGRRGEFNGFHVAHVVSQIPVECPVCFIGHSHGSRVVLSALQLAAGGQVQGHCYPYSMGQGRRYRVILAAAAVDHNWFNPGERYEYALKRSECMLNLRNMKDLPLLAYPLARPFGKRAFGRIGLTRSDIRNLGPQVAKIRDVDVRQFLNHAHYWPDYYNEPSIVNAMLPYLLFN